MPSDTERPAVLLLAHGTPNTLGEMADYLRLVTNGRALPHEVVEELQHRYAEIGLKETPGEFPPPLTRWTLAQRDLVQSLLTPSGSSARVYAAMRNWHPLIADVVKQIREDEITDLTVLCLAPQNSRTSTGLYRRALQSALDATAPQTAEPDRLKVRFIEAWDSEPLLIEAFAEKLGHAYDEARAAFGRELPVLFTAHSVPCRTIMTAAPESASTPTGGAAQARFAGPDPYPQQAKHTAELVFERVFSAPHRQGIAPPWFFAFQSQGVAGGPWIGPTVEDTLSAIAGEGYAGVMLQPVGFVCDHVEILYDIDIAFQQTAREVGLSLFRAPSLNDSELLARAIVNALTRDAADSAPAGRP